MNSDFRDKLSNAATAVEITLGMVILIACIVSGIGMVAMTDMNKLFGDPAYLQARMSSACLIIIGIELIKMITSYTIDSVVDVMLLAIARQMIVEHTSPIREPDRCAVDRHPVRDPEVSVYFASGPPPQQEGDRGGHPRRGSRRGEP